MEKAPIFLIPFLHPLATSVLLGSRNHEPQKGKGFNFFYSDNIIEL